MRKCVIMFKKATVYLFCFILVSVCSCSGNGPKNHPFSHDLHISHVLGSPSQAMICCHGLGGNYQIVEYVKRYVKTDVTLVGFNFPDHDIRLGLLDPKSTHFGTAEEILPLLYVLKQIVVIENFSEVSL